MFWLNVPIVAVAVIAGFVLVPESRDPQPGSFDLRGAALSIATLVTLVYGIIEATHGAGPIHRSSAASAPAPMLPLTFFRDPRFTVASA